MRTRAERLIGICVLNFRQMATETATSTALGAPAAFSVLSAEALDGGVVPIAILLLVPDRNALYSKFRPDLADFIEYAAAEVLKLYPAMIEQEVKAEGAVRAYRTLEDTLSNFARMSESQALGDIPSDARLLLNELYLRHVLEWSSKPSEHQTGFNPKSQINGPRKT